MAYVFGIVGHEEKVAKMGSTKLKTKYTERQKETPRDTPSLANGTTSIPLMAKRDEIIWASSTTSMFHLMPDLQTVPLTHDKWSSGPPSWPTRSPGICHLQPISHVACASLLLIKQSLTTSNNSPPSTLTWRNIGQLSGYVCRPIQGSGFPTNATW